MALYHKWDVKNDFAYVLQFFSLISDGLGSVRGEVEKKGKSKMDCTKKSQEANVKCEKRVMILSCLLVLVCACASVVGW